MEERQGPRRPCRTASCFPPPRPRAAPGFGAGWAWFRVAWVEVQPGNLDAGGRAWLQGGRGHLDCLGARATSTRAPSSGMCQSPERVFTDQSGVRTRGKEEARRKWGCWSQACWRKRKQAVFRSGRPFRSHSSCGQDLRRVPGRRWVAQCQAPATCWAPSLGHTYDGGPAPSPCPHAPGRAGLGPLLLGPSGHIWGQLKALAAAWESATGPPALPASAHAEGHSAWSPGSWRLLS